MLIIIGIFYVGHYHHQVDLGHIYYVDIEWLTNIIECIGNDNLYDDFSPVVTCEVSNLELIYDMFAMLLTDLDSNY